MAATRPRAEARRPDMEQLAFDWTGGGAAIKLLPLSAAGKERSDA